LLPAEFFPPTEARLTRLGSAFDGGYVVADDSLGPTSLLLSFGLALDWTFEEDFRARTGAKVVCFDHTVTGRFWRRYIFDSVVDAILRKTRLRTPISRHRLYNRYKVFFAGDGVDHRQEMIGPDDIGGTDIDSLMQEYDTGTGVFFKIDIEGGEYRLLDQLVRHQDSISGLVIEFHDCDSHRDRIVDFIGNFNLGLVHIHGNNFGDCDENGDPLVIEMTFKRKSSSDRPRDRSDAYPKENIDRPNNPFLKDLILSFAAPT